MSGDDRKIIKRELPWSRGDWDGPKFARPAYITDSSDLFRNIKNIQRKMFDGMKGQR